MAVFCREDNRCVAIAVLTVRIGATFKQIPRHAARSGDGRTMENIAVIRAKPCAHFEQSVIDRDQSFFCLGSYSLVEAEEQLRAGRCQNTATAAAVTVVRIGASSNGLAYGAGVEVINSRAKLRLRRAELQARLGGRGASEREEMANENRRKRPQGHPTTSQVRSPVSVADCCLTLIGLQHRHLPRDAGIQQ